MNPVQKALDELKYEIPAAILEIAFKSPASFSWQRTPISLDEQIMNKVIRPRVMVDCNLVGGTVQYISLDGLLFDRTDDFTTVYRIPKDRTQGRTILSAMNITFTSPDALNYAAGGGSQNGSTLMRLGQAMMDAHGTIPVTSTSKVSVIGENVIMARDFTIMPGYCFLHCMLGNDEHLSHIQLKSYHIFSRLVEYAVKAYIYNALYVEMDMGKLAGGQELGAIKSRVEEFKEANELYRDYLRTKWTKTSFMNDTEAWTRHIRRQVGGNR